MSPRVVLFGLDGATYTVLDDLVKRGVMPYLGEFMAESARGLLQSTVPPLTPPAWTTLVTGRSPGVHGIFNFLQYESATSPYLRIVTSRSIACETIWSIIGRYGMRAGSLNFVAHSPALKINGYMIPGWVPWRWMKQHSHPIGLVDKLKEAIPGFDVHEMAMNFKEEEKAVAGLEIADYESWIDLHIRRERQWFNVLRHQLIHDPCELTAIVFDGVDKLQHLVWQFLDPSLEPADPSAAFLRVRNQCWDYFRQLDDFLKETVWLAGPDAHVLIASDHGFCGTREIVYINTWLERKGYLTWSPTAPVETDESNELGEAHPYHLTHLDLSKTRAYATSASSNGIHIAVRGVRGDGGVAAEEYASFREELIDALLTECVDPATGGSLVARTWTREQAFAGPKVNDAPDVTVALRDGGFFSVLRSGTVLKPRTCVMGCHHPDGVLIGHGPGVRPGEKIPPARLLDITPTILHLLGVPLPADLEGTVVSDLFTEEHRRAHPVVYGDPTCWPAPELRAPPAEPCMDSESEAQVLMRLKALGYIE
jgi:predicted AlkP superfamily phosphohydrolase/phosphomutase